MSGPKAWRGSTKEARILPVFLHSPVGSIGVSVHTRHRTGTTETGENALLMEEGSGLLIPSGMVESGCRGAEGIAEVRAEMGGGRMGPAGRAMGDGRWAMVGSA